MTGHQARYSQFVGAVLFGNDDVRIGQVRRVLLDEITGHPEWVAVATGLLGARQRLAPIAESDLSPEGITVPFPASLVVSAPRFDPRDGHPSVPGEEALYRHYALDTTGSEDPPDLQLQTFISREAARVNAIEAAPHDSAPGGPGRAVKESRSLAPGSQTPRG